MSSRWPGRIVLHVDMDAFFAAVEQRDHPEWRGKPVVVGGDPKDGSGRGVVATASYEARRFGIGSAMPISQAYRACPQAVFVRPSMNKYREEGRRIRAIFREFAGGQVEPVSIDEAYLDVTHAVREGHHASAEAAARSLKKAVLGETGLTCSVGVGPSKSIAKIASDLQKPDGLTVCHPDEVASFLAPLDVRRLQGVGPKTRERLETLDIHTVGDLAERPLPWLEERFGKNGRWLWALANGQDDRPVEAGEGIPKSRSEEHTFFKDVQDPSRVNRVVRGMARELVTEMRDKGLLFRVVGIKIRNADFETWTRATTLRAPTQRLAPVLRVLRAQLSEFLDGRRRYRLVGVRLAGLERDVGQTTLEDFAGAGEEAHGEEDPGTMAPGSAVDGRPETDAVPRADAASRAEVEAHVAPPARLSIFPPWSVPGSRVRRPGQQRIDRDFELDETSDTTDPDKAPDEGP